MAANIWKRGKNFFFSSHLFEFFPSRHVVFTNVWRQQHQTRLDRVLCSPDEFFSPLFSLALVILLQIVRCWVRACAVCGGATTSCCPPSHQKQSCWRQTVRITASVQLNDVFVHKFGSSLGLAAPAILWFPPCFHFAAEKEKSPVLFQEPQMFPSSIQTVIAVADASFGALWLTTQKKKSVTIFSLIDKQLETNWRPSVEGKEGIQLGLISSL